MMCALYTNNYFIACKEIKVDYTNFLFTTCAHSSRGTGHGMSALLTCPLKLFCQTTTCLRIPKTGMGCFLQMTALKINLHALHCMGSSTDRCNIASIRCENSFIVFKMNLPSNSHHEYRFSYFDLIEPKQ